MLKIYNFKTSQENFEKLRFLAKLNKRSVNKQLEYLVESAIIEYEKFNEEIKIESEN